MKTLTHTFKRLQKLATLTIASISAAAYANSTGPDTQFYGSLRAGIDYVDAGTADDGANGRDFLSRIGLRARQELRPGLSGVAHVEYGLRSDNAVDIEQNGDTSLRLAYLGLRGSFGEILFGSQSLVWHRYVRSSYFSDLNDSIRLLTIREDDLLQYYGQRGRFHYGLGIQTEGQDGDNIDLWQMGGEYQFGSTTLQLAVLQDMRGTENGMLYGARIWVRPTGQLTLSSYWHHQDQHFDYRGSSTGNVRLRDARIHGNVNGVDNCTGEKRTDFGLYGKVRLKSSFWHARYAIDSCAQKGDIRSIKLEYVKPLAKSYKIWVAYEKLQSHEARKPVTGEDLSEAQFGLRFDF